MYGTGDKHVKRANTLLVDLPTEKKHTNYSSLELWNNKFFLKVVMSPATIIPNHIFHHPFFSETTYFLHFTLIIHHIQHDSIVR